jgi:hypothetical protein
VLGTAGAQLSAWVTSIVTEATPSRTRRRNPCASAYLRR